MTEIYIVLNKVLVKEFYRLNTGFFLVIITITFGFMSGVEHKALAEFFVVSPIILLVPIGIWMVYVIKILNFNNNQLYRKENQILFEISLLPRIKQIVQLFIVFSSQFMPAILYAGFLYTTAFKHNKLISLGIISISILFILVIGTWTMYYRVNHIHQEIKISGFKTLLDRRFTKSLFQFYIGWILRREPLLVFTTKLFSGLMIFCVTQLYKGELYDWRLLAMGATFAFGGNFMIVSQIHLFENFSFKILRNLPIHLYRRLIIYILVLLSFCLPEILILVKNFPATLEWPILLAIISFGISINFLYNSLHFVAIFQKKGFAQIIFASIISWIVLILFSVPLLLITFINMTAAIILYRTYFYQYEYNSADDGNKVNREDT